MKLEELFPYYNLDTNQAKVEVRGLSRDSRLLEDGDLFFVIEGENFDIFSILQEIENKVGGFIVEKSRKNIISSIVKNKPIIYVDDISQELMRVANLFYPVNLNSFRFIGITGTNGKTTTAHLIYTLLRDIGVEAALIGTIHYCWKKEKIQSLHTTPDYLYLRKLFHLMQGMCIQYIVMEVSSHAISQKRVKNIEYSHCIFTNLSRDHLDYHKDMNNYYVTKKTFFLDNPRALSFINTDDFYGRMLNKEIKNRKVSYGIERDALWRACDVKTFKWGSEFILFWEGKRFKVKTSLMGRHNILNLLAAISSTYYMGFPLESILKILPKLSLPSGRLEKVDDDVFVDYAHTPEALEQMLTTLREAGYKKIICVFGCGGDRDKGKRKIMGGVASSLADFSFITSDNPRSEDPYRICSQIKDGFVKDNYSIVTDRKEAIKRGYRMKNSSDCALLIAGKGHEGYQIIGKEKIVFKDQDIIRELKKESREQRSRKVFDKIPNHYKTENQNFYLL